MVCRLQPSSPSRNFGSDPDPSPPDDIARKYLANSLTQARGKAGLPSAPGVSDRSPGPVHLCTSVGQAQSFAWRQGNTERVKSLETVRRRCSVWIVGNSELDRIGNGKSASRIGIWCSAAPGPRTGAMAASFSFLLRYFTGLIPDTGLPYGTLGRGVDTGPPTWY